MELKWSYQKPTQFLDGVDHSTKYVTIPKIKVELSSVVQIIYQSVISA